MTFNELNEKLGGTEKQADWKQAKGGGWIHESAKVENDELILDNAIVWGIISGNAQVSGDAWVSGDALVSGDAWVSSPLFIIGSKFSLTNRKHGHIQIGCYCKPFKWWLGKEALELAKKQNFSPQQIKEYRTYVKLFIAIGK